MTQAAARRTPAVLRASPLARPRVLVVDDIAANTELVQIVLERAGYSVAIATGGRAAVELAARERFGLVLMDLQMPGMDGFEATRALRGAGSATADIPVVALTALGGPALVARCRAEGLAGHIQKPVSPDELVARVRALLAPGAGEVAPVAAPAESAFEVGMALLRARFRAGLGDSAAQLASLLGQAERAGWSGERRLDASRLCHGLAGSAGMFDEPAVAHDARQAERASLDAALDPTSALRTLHAALTEAAPAPAHCA